MRKETCNCPGGDSNEYDGTADEDEVHLETLSAIIAIVGKFINKAEPKENDETPYREFMKYARTG